MCPMFRIYVETQTKRITNIFIQRQITFLKVQLILSPKFKINFVNIDKQIKDRQVNRWIN